MTSHNDPSQPAGAQQVAGQGDEREHAGEWVKGWRSLFLLAATALFAIIGILFHAAAQSGTEPSSLEGPQQILGAYTTDPNATLHLSVEVLWNLQGSSVPVPFDQVNLSISGPGINSSTMVMVRSSLPAVSVTKVNNQFTVIHDPAYIKMAILPGGNGLPVDQASDYVFELPAAELISESNGDPAGAYIGSFELPGAVAQSRGSYFAHLPTAGFGVGGYQTFPSFLTELNLSTAAQNLIEYPQLKNPGQAAGRESLDPVAYRSSGAPEHLYWQPAVLDTTETLEFAEPLFTNTNVNVQPGNGILENESYTWQATGGIDPVINSTEDSAASAQDAWTFRSGIIFGIAVGTGVAFFQEDDNPILRYIARFYRSLRRRPAKASPS